MKPTDVWAAHCALAAAMCAVNGKFHKPAAIFVCCVLLAACETSPHVAFRPDPLIEEKIFSPRDRPAEISDRQEADLLTKGYVLIGTIVIQREMGGSYDTEPTTEARSEASKHGGDAIILTRNNKRMTETRYKNGRCLNEERQIRYVPDYETVCDYSVTPAACSQRQKGQHLETTTICTQWEQVPYTVDLVLTEANVFRRDAELTKQMSGYVLIMAIQNGQTRQALELIAGGANLGSRGKRGQTALTEAAAKGDGAVVKRLIHAHADVNAPGRGGATAVALAAENGHIAIVRQLIFAGADLKNGRGADTLLTAALAGHADIARLLMENGVRLEGQEASSALRAAAKDGNMESVRLILDMGTDPNAKSGGGYTALMGAAESGHVGIVKLLVARHAAVNVKNFDNGYSALFYAVESGNTESVRTLIAAGADVNVRGGAYGYTIMQTAASKEAADIVKILRAAGAKQ